MVKRAREIHLSHPIVIFCKHFLGVVFGEPCKKTKTCISPPPYCAIMCVHQFLLTCLFYTYFALDAVLMLNCFNLLMFATSGALFVWKSSTEMFKINV